VEDGPKSLTHHADVFRRHLQHRHTKTPTKGCRVWRPKREKSRQQSEGCPCLGRGRGGGGGNQGEKRADINQKDARVGGEGGGGNQGRREQTAIRRMPVLGEGEGGTRERREADSNQKDARVGGGGGNQGEKRADSKQKNADSKQKNARVEEGEGGNQGKREHTGSASNKVCRALKSRRGLWGACSIAL